MNRTFKVVGRNKSKEEMPSYVYGQPNCVAKKRVYTSLEDFKKYSPDLIQRYKQIYDVEVYELINGKWERVEI